MCIIIAKPSGILLPSKEIIRQSWVNNNDGFGLAYDIPNHPRVVISKGAMKLKQAYKLIQAVPDIKNANVIMHFRFATEGRVDPGNCHPYPVSARIQDLRATSLETHVAVVHNGIIPSMKPIHYIYKDGKSMVLPRDRGNEKLTDTQDFIRHYLVGIGKQALFNRHVGKLIEAYTNSMLALLSAQKLCLIGNFIEDNGLYFSNTSYKTNNYYGYTGWDEDGVTINYPDPDADLPPDACYKTTGRDIYSYRGFWSTNSDCDMCKQRNIVRWYEEVSSWICDDCLRFFPEIATPWRKAEPKQLATFEDDLPPEERHDDNFGQ